MLRRVQRFLIRWVSLSVAFAVTDAILPGLRVTGGFFAVIGVAAIFGIVNAVLGTVLKILTLPLTILTLGLFALVVNALMLEITAGITSRLTVSSFWLAVLAALIITVISAIVNRAIAGPRRARA
jgi:putative membrane protein